MVAAKTPRMIAGFRYEDLIHSIDWARVLLQAQGRHLREHAGSGENTCGYCIQSVLLRSGDDV